MLVSVQLLANACRVAPFNLLFFKVESLPRNLDINPFGTAAQSQRSTTRQPPLFTKNRVLLDFNLLCGKH